ncbi:MAG: thiamine-phosphate kinase [Caulobacteraceae bacterium]
MDEFDEIARLYRPLALGAPEALDLLDDAAVIPSRPGYDLVVTKDAIVAGVHFLPDDPLDLVARKLLRVNLSDLAAKGAEPDGYFLAVAWPQSFGFDDRTRFASGLAQDQAAFHVRLFGGDTVATPGPLTASLTLMGWVPNGGMVRRATAKVGDAVLVSGTIGDGGLGLRAAQGGLGGASPAEAVWLADRYRLPQPRLDLRDLLRTHASAAADVSDGLLADAAHIGEASGVGIAIDLDRLPLSPAANAWLARQADACAARLTLAGLGDDYEIVCTAAPDAVAALIEGAASAGLALTMIGAVTSTPGLVARFDGAPVAVGRTGWSHL